MFYKFFVVLLLIDAIVLVAAILLQSGKGGGLAASFGGASSSSDSFLGTRQAGNLLTKASWWCGGIFIGISFILQISSTRSSAPKSVLDNIAQPPAPTSPRKSAAPTGASAVPLQPVTPPTSAPVTPAPAPKTDTKKP